MGTNCNSGKYKFLKRGRRKERLAVYEGFRKKKRTGRKKDVSDTPNAEEQGVPEMKKRTWKGSKIIEQP